MVFARREPAHKRKKDGGKLAKRLGRVNRPGRHVLRNKGPNDFGGLTRWAAYSVGLLLALAVAFGIFGAWKSLAAAYGTPSVISLEQFRAFGGANGYQLELGMKTISNLRWAQQAMIAAIILVAAAIGLTWYGPRSASAILKIERKSLPSVCGKLLSSKDGEMDVQVFGYGTERVRIVDVIAVHAVDECP